MHDFIKNNQLQFTSHFMRLPTKIVKHVNDAANVPVSVSDISVWCFWSDYAVMYVTVTYISWSIDFALYLEDYLMDGHQKFLLFFF